MAARAAPCSPPSISRPTLRRSLPARASPPLAEGRRDAVVLVGDRDTRSASLGQSCGANFQGLNRYQRGLALVRTLDHVYPGSHRHRAVVVPGVAHSSTGMYQSPQGRDALFGW